MFIAATEQPTAAAFDEETFWRALANPWRRRILDLLRDGPRTTGDLAERLAEVSRYAVMQHLSVLTDAGLVLVERRGRQRFNHVNAAALRRSYDRWVDRYADDLAGELAALGQHLEREGPMEDGRAVETPRVLRIESELRFRAPPERVFRALTDPDEVLRWFPHTYGENRVKRIVLEPRVGGQQYEDWGDGRGYHYGHVTEWDPPFRYSVRSRLHPGTVMDTLAVLEPTDDGTRLRSSRVIVGPISDDQERGIRFHGDLARFEDAIRRVVEAD
jgi:DNA-binding transcriptional ArsR family regulator